MTLDHLVRDLGLDRYDRNARLRPALLTLLPALLVLAIWFPKVWTLFGTLVALIVSCGVLYFLAQLARARGRAVEHAMGACAGRRHTATLLSHGDDTLSKATKLRYHAYLRQHGLDLPTADEERADPIGTHARYRSAVDWLLEHTRPTAGASFLLDENIAYGFRRNLLGLKPVAIAILLCALLANASLLVLFEPDETLLWTGIALEAALCGVLFAWIWSVTEAFVIDASLGYAQRLLAHCESHGAKKRASRKAETTS